MPFTHEIIGKLTIDGNYKSSYDNYSKYSHLSILLLGNSCVKKLRRFHPISWKVSLLLVICTKFKPFLFSSGQWHLEEPSPDRAVPCSELLERWARNHRTCSVAWPASAPLQPAAPPRPLQRGTGRTPASSGRLQEMTTRRGLRKREEEERKKMKYILWRNIFTLMTTKNREI